MQNIRLGLAVTALSIAGCAARSPAPAGPPLTAEQSSAIRALMKAAGLEAAEVPAPVGRRVLRLARLAPCPCASGAPSSAPASAPTASRPRAGSATTLLQCDVGCDRLGFAARSLLRGVGSGEESDEEIATRLRQRFGPRTPRRLDLASAACRGPARGAEVVQLVVFSDFQCPFCAMARVLVEILERRAPAPLEVCFKHYPLVTMHRHARIAAQATVAAQLQGKFWPLHDRLFAHPKELERQQLFDHARAVGLDMRRFERDLDSPFVRLRVERDRSEAIAQKIPGTPTFFIDGHEMIDPKSIPDFLDWIAEAALLRRLGAAR